MKIAINAISVRRGGPVIALHKLLSGFIKIAPEHEYYVLANNALLPLWKAHPSIHYQYFPWAENGYGRMALWYGVVLPYWLRKCRIDVLFSHTCYLPPIRPARTVLLVQDAKYFHDSESFLSADTAFAAFCFRLKRLWSRRSVVVADRILVQSESLKRRITDRIPSARDRIAAVHHGPGCLDGPQVPIHGNFFSDSLEIAYVAYYREYKNFDVLLHALQILRDRGVLARLHLTLDLVEDAGARKLMSRARQMGVEGSIVNHGELAPERVVEVYQSAHIFVFPSVCESFGFPQVEAMAFGLPLLASDTSVNREICADGALYFAYDSPAELAASLEHLYRNPRELRALGKRSALRGQNFDWSRAAAETLRCLSAVQGVRNPSGKLLE